MIPLNLRSVVGSALVERLFEIEAFVLRAAISGKHLLLLTKLPFGKAREWSGIAKRHAWFMLLEYGWKGKLWGKRGKEVPVKSREHQLRMYHYIGEHEQQGAWVWTWPAPKDGDK